MSGSPITAVSTASTGLDRRAIEAQTRIAARHIFDALISNSGLVRTADRFLLRHFAPPVPVELAA